MRNDILNRRQMMIDKSEWKELEGVDALKSTGCVFYLPLNANTDIGMTDLISGNQLILKNDSYFDDDIGMYRFKSTSTPYDLNASYINVDWDSTTFPSDSYTVIANFRVVERINNKYAFSACLYTGSVLPAFILVTETGTTHTIALPIEKTLMGAIISANRRIYICGDKTGYFGAHTPYLPSSWINKYDNKLYFGLISEIKNAGVEYYLSDLMIFNKELSQNEIDKIFNDIKNNNFQKAKRRIKSLSITANDVIGRKTNTTINYTVTWEYKYEDGTREEKIEYGTATSEEFPQNTSYTDTIQRTIKFTYNGKTATTTITQGVWVDLEYTINLNSQWLESSIITNPDSSLYDGVYESYSNKGVGNSGASMYITINGYSNFKLYIRSYAESSYDYVMVSQLDKTLTHNSSYSDTSLVKFHTHGSQNSGTSIGSYLLVEFTNIDNGEHTILIIYKKDASVDNGNDCGYVLIPKDQ